MHDSPGGNYWGNTLIHEVDGVVTAKIFDLQEDARAMVGLLAFQVHRGNPMEVQIKDVKLRRLPEGGLVESAQITIPEDA